MRKKHGLSRTPTYNAWQKMLARCRTSDPRYKDYGPKGIRVCERWSKFELFFADMGERPAGHSLDRIDSSGNYEPGNCRWATNAQQARNKCCNRYYTHNGKTQTLTDWSMSIGLGKNGVFKRLLRGWSVEDAITLPNMKAVGRFSGGCLRTFKTGHTSKATSLGESAGGHRAESSARCPATPDESR